MPPQMLGTVGAGPPPAHSSRCLGKEARQLARKSLRDAGLRQQGLGLCPHKITQRGSQAPQPPLNSCLSVVAFTCCSKKAATFFSLIFLLSSINIPPQFLYISFCLFFFFFSWLPHNKNVSLILILLLRQSKPSLLSMPYKSQKRSDSVMQDFI